MTITAAMEVMVIQLKGINQSIEVTYFFIRITYLFSPDRFLWGLLDLANCVRPSRGSGQLFFDDSIYRGIIKL